MTSVIASVLASTLEILINTSRPDRESVGRDCRGEAKELVLIPRGRVGRHLRGAPGWARRVRARIYRRGIADDGEGWLDCARRVKSWRTLVVLLYQTDPDGIANQAGDFVDTQPVHQLGPVRLYGFHADAQAARDSLGGLTLGHQHQDF